MKRILEDGILSFRDTEPNGAACFACGYEMDAATPLNGRNAPKAGSVSICARCGEISMFVDDRLLREPTDEELADIRSSKSWPLIHEAQTLIRARQNGGRR